MLHTMYCQDEIRTVPDFGKNQVNLKDAEVKVAYQLIEALSAEWEPAKYYDTFENNIKKLIKARLEGKEVVAVEKPRKAAPSVDLMAALKQSLAQMEAKKKSPQRAEGAQQMSEAEVQGKRPAATRKKTTKKAA
jgi:DNA end-binding protein Ku